MHLVVIGHTAHYLRSGQLVGWGPTVKEVNWLARAFDRITHVACFHPGPAPKSALPYETDTVRFVPVPPSGGRTLRDKLRVLACAPRYLTEIWKNVTEADVIHVRSPGSVALYAIFLLWRVKQKPRWVKYAGNWMQTGVIPPSFAFQRWWLRKGLSRGPVTVNGRWPDQPNHVFSFDNPSMTLQDIQVARSTVVDKRLEQPLRFVFVGRTETVKGLGIALEVTKSILSHCRDIYLDVLGDGPERQMFERMSAQLGLTGRVTFHGWVPHDHVCDFLVRSHFILLASSSEGWPKVLSEAMSYGVVPVASDVSAIPQILEETGAGVALPVRDVAGFTRAIVELIHDPTKWGEMSRAGMDAAPRFTYERYLIALDEMFRSAYGSSPMNAGMLAEIRRRFEAFVG
jgi:glycosyltransferase involved in cell wall biosynthesis